ncbi:hypothetical protein FRB94_003555 [Tulasnella sp. JGI-2019a]|nr:hypothetical protein FRB94_003555 [Tulasnella sp. JGI-2019a]
MPHNLFTFGYTGYSPQFPNPSSNVTLIITPPISDSSQTDSTMPYRSSAPFFITNGRDISGPSYNQCRLSISSSPSSMSDLSPGSPCAQPVVPISQYLDQIQQQQQYQPDSFVTHLTLGLLQANLIQQLVHSGVLAGEVVRMMGEVASGSLSGRACGAPVDKQPPLQYGDEKGGMPS